MMSDTNTIRTMITDFSLKAHKYTHIRDALERSILPHSYPVSTGNSAASRGNNYNLGSLILDRLRLVCEESRNVMKR